MSNEKELSASARARLNVAKLRRDLSAASDPATVENLLPALPGDNIAKLQSSRQGSNCKVIFGHIHIPDGARPDEIDIVLTKDGLNVSAVEQLPNPVGPDFSMTLLGLHTDTPGPFRLGYTLKYGSTDTPQPVSIFHIDTVAPNHGAPGLLAVPPTEIVDNKNIISREYIDREGKVVMSIATPDDARQGDTVRGYYGYSIPSIEIGMFTFSDDLTMPITIDVSKATIESGGEGARIFYFRYEDRVGNVGPPSAPTDFTVQLTPVPSGLQPPEVPAFDDGLVDRTDATPSVAVIIPTFDNGLTGDQAQVVWGSRLQSLKSTDGTSEVIVEVPYSDVAFGGDGPKDALVSYVIVREGINYPETTGLMVKVDLTIAGPDFPDPDPDVGNPALQAPTVKGGSTTEPNKLLEGDVGQPAIVTAPIYTDAKLDDEVRLYWDGVAVPGDDGVFKPDGTEDPGDLMTFTLASSIFEGTNNGLIKAHYVITNPANGDNENPSLRQEVDVYIYPVTLPAPVIQHLYTSETGRISLGCTSLRDIPVIGKVAIVRVGGGTDLAVDMELNFTWTGVKYEAGGGETPVPTYTFTKKLQGNEADVGFDVYLPYHDSLIPIADGRGVVRYTTVIAGRTHTSADHDVRVIVIDTDENFCPGT